MERIRISRLRPGQTFPKALFTPSGQKLLAAGTAITESHIATMERTGEFELILADDLSELTGNGMVEPVDTSKLRVGQKVKRSVLSGAGQVIVESDEPVEAHHLDALEAGGRSFASKREISHQRRERILMCDALLEDLLKVAQRLDLRVAAAAEPWPTTAGDSSFPGPEQLSRMRNDAVETIRKHYAQIEAGINVELASFEALIDPLLDLLARFPTCFTQLALLTPRRGDYLPDHVYTVAVLSMAIAAQLRWPREAVRQIGVAGLLFDLGMLLVPQRVRVSRDELADVDRSRVHQHPVYTLSMLRHVAGVEPIVQLAAVQHHERENGTGYPRRTRNSHNCDFARVLAVADTFAAATEPREYRKVKLPYIAMEETIRAASTQEFWMPAVRALVQAAGLFPVGSFVKLSDGRAAHVVASNSVKLNRPVVQPLDKDGKPIDEAVDLATIDDATLTIVRPIFTAAG